MPDDSTRDRIRALVRDVLRKLPAEEPNEDDTQTNGPAPVRFIDTAPGQTSAGLQQTRDESSKLVITEDDVRGLEEGAVLRIAEGARLTPLAADIVRDRRIEIVRRVP